MLAGLNISEVEPALTLLSSVMSETCLGHLTFAVDTSAELSKKKAVKDAEEANDNDLKDQEEAKDPSEFRTIDHVKNAIIRVVQENLPYKCLQKVKRHLRRNCQKPFDMKVRVTTTDSTSRHKELVDD